MGDSEFLMVLALQVKEINEPHELSILVFLEKWRKCSRVRESLKVYLDTLFKTICNTNITDDQFIFK